MRPTHKPLAIATSIAAWTPSWLRRYQPPRARAGAADLGWRRALAWSAAISAILYDVFASLLAAMTIAGAFWVGVLAARRLRDWGDGRRAIEEGDGPARLALPPSAPPNDPRTRRVRAALTARLGELHLGSDSGNEAPARDELTLLTTRPGDVVMIEGAEDYIVEGVVNLREGARASVLLVLDDGGHEKWLVGAPDDATLVWLDPVPEHNLAGEPPRYLQRGELEYTLARRGQASAAGLGAHKRPGEGRVATYLFRATGDKVAWAERWGDRVFLGEGRMLAASMVTLLPGS